MISDCTRDSGNNKCTVLESRKVYETDCIVKIVHHRVSNGDGQSRLAHTTRANDTYESLRDDHRPQGVDVLVAANHSPQARRQRLSLNRRRRGHRALLQLPLSWCNKAIASAGDVSDVSCAS